MTEYFLETSVSAWTIDHPDTLVVFQELGIDYSCGEKLLEFACRKRGLDEQSVPSQLQEGIDGGNQKFSPSSPT